MTDGKSKANGKGGAYEQRGVFFAFAAEYRKTHCDEVVADKTLSAEFIAAHPNDPEAVELNAIDHNEKTARIRGVRADRKRDGLIIDK